MTDFYNFNPETDYGWNQIHLELDARLGAIAYGQPLLAEILWDLADENHDYLADVLDAWEAKETKIVTIVGGLGALRATGSTEGYNALLSLYQSATESLVPLLESDPRPQTHTRVISPYDKTL